MPTYRFLKNRIHPDADMDLEDSARTKLALSAQGFLDTPQDQLTEFPDQDMINGLKKFQKANNLRVDGIMELGGPTENKVANLMDVIGMGTWTFTPEKPTKRCNGQWVRKDKKCVGDICIYSWECLSKPVHDGRG